MTVQQLGRAMDSKEFSEWMIFYKMRNEEIEGSRGKTNSPEALQGALMGVGRKGKR